MIHNAIEHKTRETYAEYRKTGYSKKFFEEHREEITLHKAAKEAFPQIKGPIPKIRELNEEYERVLREKKQTYAEYRQACQDMKDYQTAKYNVEQFLRKEEDERQAETRKRTEQVRYGFGRFHRKYTMRSPAFLRSGYLYLASPSVMRSSE